MKRKQTIYEWLTLSFSVHIRNDKDFSLKRSFRLNYAKIIVLIVLTSTLISAVSISLFRWADGYYSSEIRREKAFRNKILLLNQSLDSLEAEISRKDSFILSFRQMLTGENEVEETTRLKNRQENKQPLPDKRDDKVNQAESNLRNEFETTKKANANILPSQELTVLVNNKSSLSDIYFFPPISGLVSNHYDTQTKHYGIDILAKENEPIKSVSDGSVIYSGWSYDTGYMLVVQHDEDLISVYKHNASLLKKVGENVKSGEVVAIIGNSGELTTGPHLHFELWYKGHPLNPLDYIVF